MSPLKGNVILKLILILPFQLLIGYLEAESTVINKIRTLTDIEETIIRKVITKSLDNLQESLEACGQYRTSLGGY